MLLTKSRYLLGIQCKKCLWTAFHDKDAFPPVDRAQQHIFDQGHQIGELAKGLFPGGIDIPTDDFMANIRKTKALLDMDLPLFEPGFMVDGLFARPDILQPDGKVWDIIEVKSSTSVKEINIHDVAFQKHLLEKCGLQVGSCYLLHINNKYVREGEVDPAAFFTKEDITEQVEELESFTDKSIQEMKDLIAKEACPDLPIGPHCSKPYTCPLHDGCWEHIPKGSVFSLSRGGKKSFQLYESDIIGIEDIPDDFKLTANQKIQKGCAITGQPYIDKEKVKGFISQMEYPLYFLDFETFNTALPLYDGSRPYQQIPFQFSLHIVKDKGSEPEHISFLAKGDADPRPDFLEALKGCIGDKGSIVVYNQGFEVGRLKECADCFTEHAGWIESCIERIKDLYTPFQKFWYYHPGQQGSASIKKVLPALVGKGYDGMDIADGATASLEFLRIISGKVEEREMEKIRLDLERYCCLDTEAMILLLEALERVLVETD